MARMHTMLRRATQFACAAALLAAAAAHAQSDGLKIGFVNFQQVIAQAPQSETVSNALREEFAPRQRELEAMQSTLTEKQERYQRDAPVMAEEERVALEREIRDEQREFQRAQQELQEDFNIRQNEEVSELQRELIREIQAFARNAGYDLVLADAIHVSEAANITADVIAAIREAAEESD